MRVERRVALSGKVLRAGGDATTGHAANARHAVAAHDLRVLAVGANPDVRTVAFGQDVQHGTETQIDAEPSQLARLDQSLTMRERLLAGGADGEVVGEDRHAAAQHHDAAALVVRRDEQTAPERRFEIAEELQELSGRFEIAPVEDEARRACLAEEAHVVVAHRRADESDHETFADEIFEVDHTNDLTRLPGANPSSYAHNSLSRA